MNRLIYYLLIINIISFVFFGLDKYLAIKKKNRISEFTLLSLVILGGVIGSLMGMFIFRHKTRKLKFYLFVVISLATWLYIILGSEVKIWNIH